MGKHIKLLWNASKSSHSLWNCGTACLQNHRYLSMLLLCWDSTTALGPVSCPTSFKSYCFLPIYYKVPPQPPDSYIGPSVSTSCNTHSPLTSGIPVHTTRAPEEDLLERIPSTLKLPYEVHEGRSYSGFFAAYKCC